MSEERVNNIAVYRSLAEIPRGFGPSVAAIGNFDGVHLGHQEILSAVVRQAQTLGARSVAITFDPHPQQFLRPQRTRRIITPLGERLRLLSQTGIDTVLILPFNANLASMTARDFAQDVLKGLLDVRAMHEGANFRFGQGAAAGVKELAEFGAEMDFVVQLHEAVRVHRLEVSSSAIRKLVAEGDVRRARWMLGRPFALLSTSARGRGIGAKQVVPTVNLAPYDGLIPAIGVYVTRLKIAGRTFQSVTNVGNRPTFGPIPNEDSFAIESHILDQKIPELPEDTPLELEFLMRLRGEIAWPSPEALKAQIFKDVARAKHYFRRTKAL
jgi:riboflavin kinase/FMN adenylyltransferase